MAYRDDLEAVRLREAQLERELEEARGEIARLREKLGEKVEVAPSPGVLAPSGPSHGGGVGGIVIGITLLVLGLAAIAVLRAPPTMVGGVTLLVLGALVLYVSALGRLLCIARPSEALVVSGSRHNLPDGSMSTMRIVHGGRVVRKPFIESVRALDLRVLPVDVSVSRAFCRGSVPLTIAATALVKVSSDPALTRHAAERFLDLNPVEIAQVAAQTLEGCVREVVAGLDLERLEDRVRLNEAVADAAPEEFDRLGLELMGFWVIGLSDDQHQLEARDRRRVAEMLRDVGLPTPEQE